MTRLSRVRVEVQHYNNLSILSLDAFVGGLQNAAMGAVWQPFVLSLGATMSELGLLNSLGGPGGIFPTLIQPVGGWLADRSGRKPLILISTGLQVLRFIFCLIAGITLSPIFLAASVIAVGLSFLDQPATTALAAESVTERNRGSAFSILVVVRMLPGIIAPAVAGFVADRFGFNPIFGALILVNAIAFLVFTRFLRETRKLNVIGREWADARAFILRSFVPPKHLRAFFVAIACDSFSWGIGWGLLYGMLTKTYNFTTEQIGVMLSVMSLTWVLIQLPIGRYIDRRGTRSMLILSEAIGPPLLLIWLFSSSFEVFVASHVLFALTAATWVPAVNTYVSKHVDEAERAEVFGRLSAFRGLIGFPAPFIGGLLFDRFGIQAPLLGNLIGSVITVFILFLFVHERTGVSRQPLAVSREK